MTYKIPQAEGYPDPGPCDVCGIRFHGNSMEPRFGYVTCFWHSNIPPAYRQFIKQDYARLKEK